MTSRTPPAKKRVLVTGAANGIGAAIVDACVSAGHTVVATDIDEKGLAELRQARPGTETVVLDVRDLDAWERVISRSESQGGPIDVLINNAGVCLAGRCDRVSAEDDRRTVEVNLVGVMNGVRTILPRFLERKCGHVINVASMAAFFPAPDLAAYCATKHAVRAYTHSCALDHRHAPVEWTVACPGAVETPMLERMRKKRVGAVVFSGHPMQPQQVASAVVDAIETPRREVLVTTRASKLLRLLGLFPGLVARGVDDAERQGRVAFDD
jgi:NADP-dependent 3-hydroxy acid dehydrogenase YdfG